MVHKLAIRFDFDLINFDLISIILGLTGTGKIPAKKKKYLN